MCISCRPPATAAAGAAGSAALDPCYGWIIRSMAAGRIEQLSSVRLFLPGGLRRRSSDRARSYIYGREKERIRTGSGRTWHFAEKTVHVPWLLMDLPFIGVRRITADRSSQRETLKMALEPTLACWLVLAVGAAAQLSAFPTSSMWIQLYKLGATEVRMSWADAGTTPGCVDCVDRYSCFSTAPARGAGWASASASR
jgi:hypothetical protein